VPAPNTASSGASIGPGWEIAQALGLVAVIGCLLLLLIPVRPRALSAHSLSLRRHEWIGWAVLAATLAHVMGLIIDDRRVVEHLRPTAPIYEWAGILALLLLLVLVPASTATVRRLFWANHRRFQAVHVGTACALVPVLAVHVLTADHFVHGWFRVTGFVATSIVALAAMLRGRPLPETPLQRVGLIARMVFGRHSRKVLAIVGVSSLATLALLRASPAITLREPFAARAVPLRVDFPHDKHRAVECVECHHNFVDRTGSGSCYSCHRSARADLKVGAEARFHDFCLHCHRDPRPAFERHGPVTGCSTCHADSVR